MNTLRLSLRASILLASVSPLLHADTLTVEGDLNTTGDVTIGTVSQAKNLNVTGDVTIAGALEVDGQAVVTADQLATYVTATQLTGYVTANQLSSAGYLTTSGSGASLTNLNANALAAGTISVDRLPAAVSQLGATIELNDAETTGLLSWSRVNKEDSSLADLVTRDYADLQGTPTTLSGYGITDAVAKDEDGNVGIGTDTPELKLHIKDIWAGIRLESTVPGFASSGSIFAGGGGIFFRNDVDDKNPFSVSMSAPSHSLEVAANGNVGLGTFAPTAKLDVLGDVKVSGALTVGGNSVVTTDQLSGYLTSTGSGANLTNISAAAITATGTRDATTFLRGDNTWAVPPGGGGGSGVTDGDKGDITVSSGGASWTVDNGLPLSRLATDPLARANHTGTQAWATISGTPATLSGYGITDAVAKDGSGNVVIAGTLTVGGQTVVTANQLTGFATTSELAGYLATNGSGANLTNLNASAISSGTLPAGVLPAGVTQLGGTIELGSETTGQLAWANVTKTNSTLADLVTRNYTDLQNIPSTLAGHGITDAVQKNTNGDVVIAGSTTLTGPVTIEGVATVNGRVAKLRVERQGDLSMGTFLADPEAP